MPSIPLLPLLTIASCFVSLTSVISRNFARNVILSMAFLTVTTRILAQLLPKTRIAILDKVLIETEHTLHAYVEGGVLPLDFRADLALMKLKLQASSLHEETLRIDSSLWKECWACCTGLSLAIFRCQRATQALHVRILIAIESHQQIIFKEDIEHKRHTAFPLGISSGTDRVGVSNALELPIPAPCVIAGSYRLRQPPPPPPDEVTPETIMMNVLNNLN